MIYRREWTRQAMCAGRDPRAYELDGFTGDRVAYARGACAGCPVMVECAADALEPLAVGTVRAGVWIPADHNKTRAVRRQLASVVAGAVGVAPSGA